MQVKKKTTAHRSVGGVGEGFENFSTPYAQHKRAGARQPFAGNAGQQSRANWPIHVPGNSQEPTGPSEPRPHYPAAQQPGWVGGKTQGKLCRQDCSVTKPTVHRLSCSNSTRARTHTMYNVWRSRCGERAGVLPNPTEPGTPTHAHLQSTMYGGVGMERAGALANPEHKHQTLRVRTLDEAAAARWLLAANC